MFALVVIEPLLYLFYYKAVPYYYFANLCFYDLFNYYAIYYVLVNLVVLLLTAPFVENYCLLFDLLDECPLAIRFLVVLL